MYYLLQRCGGFLRAEPVTDRDLGIPHSPSTVPRLRILHAMTSWVNEWMSEWVKTNHQQRQFPILLNTEKWSPVYAPVSHFLTSRVLTGNSRNIKEGIHDVPKQCAFGIKWLAKFRKITNNDSQPSNTEGGGGILMSLSCGWWSRAPAWGILPRCQTAPCSLLTEDPGGDTASLSAAGKGWLKR